MSATTGSEAVYRNHALFARVQRNSQQVVVPINQSAVRADPSRPAFYCIHSLSGAAGTDFADMAEYFDPDVRFYGIQAPPKDMQDQRFGASLESLAEHYANALMNFQPQGPMMLGGYCVGAVIALEVAKYLRAHGREVGPLLAIDGAPENSGKILRRWRPRYWLDLIRNVPGWFAHADLMRNRSLHSLVWSLSNNAYAIGKGVIGLRRGQKFGGGYAVDGVMDIALYPVAHRQFINRLYAAIFSYVPNGDPGEVVVYEATVTPLLYLPQVGRTWRNIAPTAEVVGIVGTHIGMVRGPYVDVLARDMRTRVARYFAKKSW